jgi:glycosyltransferase involved in cell wall biosynthesis
VTKVSVIMPVLNGAQTIGRAISSLVAQSMPDFELIVVDDGSTDQTGQIVQELARKDSRILHFSLDKNHGVGFARNKALEKCCGMWITPLDADDWMDPGRLEYLLKEADRLYADVVLDNMRLIGKSDGQVKGETCFGQQNEVEHITSQMLFDKDTPYADFAIGFAQPLFRASFLKEKGIRYNESYALGEDFVFLAYAMLHGAKVYAVPYTGYNYVYGSLKTQNMMDKSNRQYSQVIDASNELLRIFKHSLSPEVQASIMRRRKLFELLEIARTIKTMIREHRWLAAIVQMIKHPKVLLLVCRVTMLRLSLLSLLAQ